MSSAKCHLLSFILIAQHEERPRYNIYVETSHCSMHTPLSDDKHQFVQIKLKKALWKSEAKFRQNARIFSNNFFVIRIFPNKRFCWKNILRFCLGLNFVVDYIPQLHFICNHLICFVVTVTRHCSGYHYIQETKEYRWWWIYLGFETIVESSEVRNCVYQWPHKMDNKNIGT